MYIKNVQNKIIPLQNMIRTRGPSEGTKQIR